MKVFQAYTFALVQQEIVKLPPSVRNGRVSRHDGRHCKTIETTNVYIAGNSATTTSGATRKPNTARGVSSMVTSSCMGSSICFCQITQNSAYVKRKPESSKPTKPDKHINTVVNLETMYAPLRPKSAMDILPPSVSEVRWQQIYHELTIGTPKNDKIRTTDRKKRGRIDQKSTITSNCYGMQSNPG